jgi:NADPH-dependent 2,4-dienoyl-CoA reductase/sulfur reductase-like enzyme/rhodanese-related sulfurtransferase
MGKTRIIVVGGVAGGMSAAVRARRLDEEAEIQVFEKGPYVSFANCGLPYHVGGEIEDRAKLVLQTPKSIGTRFNVTVHVRTEVLRIDREAHKVVVKNLEDGSERDVVYDRLILSTGSRAFEPPIPGFHREGHFPLRTIPEMDAMQKWIARPEVKRAVVVGGGFIGLEIAEQLKHRGLDVSLAEFAPQIMLPLDPEMAALLQEQVRLDGIDLHLGAGVESFLDPSEGSDVQASRVRLSNGVELDADLVALCLGVRPEISLAQEAGLEIGSLGGIRVDARLRTEDPRIWAIGDAIEVKHPVTGSWTRIPLAGPANRQGRIAAENALGAGREYKGTVGTSILRIFSLAAGATGANEATLKREGRRFQVVHVHRTSHAGYYPGAKMLTLKLLFDPGDGRLLGAQGVGADGVDKRIDVLATALQAGLTVYQIAELELSYSPPFGNAKDPVNIAAMAACNVLDGLVKLVAWDQVPLDGKGEAQVVDVRSAKEFASGHIPGAVNISVDNMREQMEKLDKERPVHLYCGVGQRSYYAHRILAAHGFQSASVDGGYRTWSVASREAAKLGC